jgi:hypothetical protein
MVVAVGCRVPFRFTPCRRRFVRCIELPPVAHRTREAVVVLFQYTKGLFSFRVSFGVLFLDDHRNYTVRLRQIASLALPCGFDCHALRP